MTSSKTSTAAVSFTSSLPGGCIEITLADGRVFRSLGKPSLFTVRDHLARGARPEGSAKWALVRTVSANEATECRGCEFCDGEGATRSPTPAASRR